MPNTPLNGHSYENSVSLAGEIKMDDATKASLAKAYSAAGVTIDEKQKIRAHLPGYGDRAEAIKKAIKYGLWVKFDNSATLDEILKKILPLESILDQALRGSKTPGQNKAAIKNYIKGVTKHCKDQGMKSKDIKALLKNSEQLYLLRGKPRPIITTAADIPEPPEGLTTTSPAKRMVVMEIPMVSLSEDLVDVFAKIIMDRGAADEGYDYPVWWEEMSPDQQDMFLAAFHTYNNEEDLKAYLRGPLKFSNKLEFIPGVRNYWKNVTVVLDEEGNVISQTELLRSAASGARSEKGDSPIQKEITGANVNTVVQDMLETAVVHREKLGLSTDEIPILLGTNLTPIPVIRPEDTALVTAKNDAITDLPKVFTVTSGGEETRIHATIIGTNHPYNIGGIVMLVEDSKSREWLKAGKDDLAKLEQLEKEAKQEKNPERKKVIAKLDWATKALEKTLNSNLRYGFHEGLHLYLSAYEGIIGQAITGTVHRTCVSGNDRNGLYVMWQDAMNVYYATYGKLPLPTDSAAEKEAFYAIAYPLYQHQERVANQNAPGAAGIKEAEKVLPADFCRYVERQSSNEKFFKESGDRAKLNDIDKIKKPWYKGVQKIAKYIGGVIPGVIALVILSVPATLYFAAKKIGKSRMVARQPKVEMPKPVTFGSAPLADKSSPVVPDSAEKAAPVTPLATNESLGAAAEVKLTSKPPQPSQGRPKKTAPSSASDSTYASVGNSLEADLEKAKRTLKNMPDNRKKEAKGYGDILQEVERAQSMDSNQTSQKAQTLNKALAWLGPHKPQRPTAARSGGSVSEGKVTPDPNQGNPLSGP